jgi:hypothetical protein
MASMRMTLVSEPAWGLLLTSQLVDGMIAVAGEMEGHKKQFKEPTR